MSASSLITQMINGVNQASVLLIAALGLIIIFGLMGVINMAHGELIMIGGFCAYIFSNVLHFPFAVAVVFSFLVTAVVGVLIEVLVIKRLYAKPTETILATYGISMIISEIARLKWPLAQNVNMPIPGTAKVAGISIPFYNMFVLLFAFAVLSFTIFLFKKTKFGKKVNAITQNRQMVECLGINTAKYDTLTFAYGAGLAGIAGCILAPTVGVSYQMGAAYLTNSFLTVVLGGVESMIGLAASSAIFGEGKTVLAGFSNDCMAKIMMCLVVVAIIRFKPEGLFHKERR